MLMKKLSYMRFFRNGTLSLHSGPRLRLHFIESIIHITINAPDR